MKLDPDLIHYLTKEHFRVLTAVEMGMRNHEFVPVPVIEQLAALKRSNVYKVIQLLLKHKLLMHHNKQYSGYALTYMGYDYLALKAFIQRGHIKTIGIKIGVGKESDIYLCETEDGETLVLKFARLGRTSFRSVKNNRDYIKNRTCYSWLYLSRIASLKEFAFMKVLHEKGFPTPRPVDSNRHAIVMSFVRAYPMSQVKELKNPTNVYEELLNQIIKLAEHGLVHGDFNEFNLMIDDDEVITIIDFPQMTSINHPNAQYYFERDVKCIQDFFLKRFGLKFEGIPILETVSILLIYKLQDINKVEDLDKEVKASGFLKSELEGNREAFDQIVNSFIHKYDFIA